MFHILNSIFSNLLKQTSLDFFRYYYHHLEQDIEVVGIVGERGIGKTTSLLQYAKRHENSFYFSADNAVVQSYGLFKTVFELFDSYGVEHVLIDEIHTFPNWVHELKNIIDSFPGKKIIFSGSSSLDIISGTASLERRVKVIQVFPLDLSEFLYLNYGLEVPVYSFEDIIERHARISFELSHIIQKKHIEHYMKSGFYPYAASFGEDIFYEKLFNTQEKIITDDLPSFLNLQSTTLIKLKKIFYFIAHTLPGDLNYSSLGRKIGISADTLENIVFILSKIGVIQLVPKSVGVSDMLRKEFKIYLGNPNLYYSYDLHTDTGIVRESFIIHFLKRLTHKQREFDTELSLPASGDIHLRYKGQNYIFEVGGRSKSKKQIPAHKNAFIVADDIIISEQGKIPLWLFGLLRK